MFKHDIDFFTYQEHLGVICNTDGVSIFKSGCTTLWPIYLEIANLPPSIRFRQDNILISGVWVGQSKPPMKSIFNETLKDIDHLNSIGFDYVSPEGQVTIRLKLLFGVFDLIAKAQVLNIKQFNGYHGCPTCLNPGEYHGVHVYSPGKFQLRTDYSFETAATDAHQRGIVIDGIKGISPFHRHMNLVSGFPFDYMHSILEGVVKSMLKFWTESKYSKQPF